MCARGHQRTHIVVMSVYPRKLCVDRRRPSINPSISGTLPRPSFVASRRRRCICRLRNSRSSCIPTCCGMPAGSSNDNSVRPVSADDHSNSPVRRVPAPGNSAPKVFAPLGAMQRLVVSQLFLAEKTNGQFKESQLPSQLLLQFGRNNF